MVYVHGGLSYIKTPVHYNGFGQVTPYPYTQPPINHIMDIFIVELRKKLLICKKS